MVTAIVAAAGLGRRMGRGINKVFIPLFNRPVLIYSMLALSSCPEVDNLIVVAVADETEMVKTMLTNATGLKRWQVVEGGSERQYSIGNALKAVPESTEIILVHDGARPLIEPELISRLIAAARRYRAAGVAVPVKDTIKTVDKEGFVIGTPARHTLWAIQTPQAFEAGILRQAYRQAAEEDYLGTDDAGLVERLGVQVKIVQGSYSNIKITTPEDIAVAKALLNESQENTVASGKISPEVDRGCEPEMRIGIGYDVHRLVEGRRLILGGVEIPYIHGLQGHSDADVLLHAIKDAMLGAAALGDIGRHFPDSDPTYEGASSLRLLAKVKEILAEHGFRINNVDATIVAQKPKLALYIPEMNASIARELAVGITQVNVKATTTEGLGFAGRQEGIAAYAVVSIVHI